MRDQFLLFLGFVKLKGWMGVNVARLGGTKVLITFRDLGEVLPVIQKANSEMEKKIIHMERWMPAQPCSSRVVWVRCFGVPLLG